MLVNDGSPDNSSRSASDLATATRSRRDGASTSARNFGEHNAVMAGLAHARGAHIITMDDDLQNPPEEVVRLLRHTLDNDYDVVYSYYDRSSTTPGGTSAAGSPTGALTVSSTSPKASTSRASAA